MSPDGARVAFQLERFELTGDDRLEVVGRWFGVRGLRFVRPSLTVHTDEGERSLLALLEHKPWAAEEGDSWVAAFPWHGGYPDPDRAELAVAPSVVVALAEKTKKATAPQRRPLRDRLDASEARVRHLEAEVAFLREEREQLVGDARAARAEREPLEAALAAAEQERDDALREQSRVAKQRDEAVAERNDARAERDAALRERDEALRARDAVLAEHSDSDALRNKAAREREAALRERDQAIRDRDRARAELDEAAEARTAAETARDAALRERDAALGRGTGFPAVSAADLQREPYAPSAMEAASRIRERGARATALTARLRARGAAARQQDSTDTALTARIRARGGVARDWTARAVALAALVTFLLLLVLFLKLL